MAQKITVRNNQNLFDICLQVSGGYAALLELSNNNDLSITDALEAGVELLANIPADDLDILDYYNRYRIIPTTGSTENLEVEVRGGIGYMAIGVDFIVS